MMKSKIDMGIISNNHIKFYLKKKHSNILTSNLCEIS